MSDEKWEEWAVVDEKNLEPRSHKFCNICGDWSYFFLSRVIVSSGAKYFAYVCECCGRAKGDSPWVSKAKILASGIDTLDLETVCFSPEYCLICGRPGAELHHFAPQSLFDDCDKWPQAYLCKEHHDEWHKKMAPLSGLAQRGGGC